MTTREQIIEILLIKIRKHLGLLTRDSINELADEILALPLIKREAEVKHPIDADEKINKKVTYCYHCGQSVKHQKYCHNCGYKLIWKNLPK